MFQLVALDVDGTILDSHHRLPPRITAAIRATVAAGVTVILATGKLYRSIDPLVELFGLSGPQITCNGAAIVSAGTGEMVASWPLAGAPLTHTLAVLQHLDPPPEIAWYLNDGIVTDGPPGYLDEILTAYLEPPPQRVAQLHPDALPPPLKLLTTGTPAELLRRRQQTEPLLGDAVHVVRTSVDFLEYQNPLSNKGQALATVQRMLGIPRAATLAIGDGENDLSLLAAAGLGVAMANGAPALRQQAAALTASNDEDGVAVALERYILS